MKPPSSLKMLPCLDSAELARCRRRELDLPRQTAAELGRSAVEAAERGYYGFGADRRID